jgi:hypothetical protein
MARALAAAASGTPLPSAAIPEAVKELLPRVLVQLRQAGKRLIGLVNPTNSRILDLGQAQRIGSGRI